MSEMNQEQNEIFDMLEESLPAHGFQGDSKDHENFSHCNDEEHRFEFLIQDMFLDHFFP